MLPAHSEIVISTEVEKSFKIGLNKFKDFSISLRSNRNDGRGCGFSLKAHSAIVISTEVEKSIKIGLN